MLDLTEDQLAIVDNMASKKKIQPGDFCLGLEKYVREHRIDYLEALQHFCEFYDLKYTDAPKYLTESVKQKIAKENGILNSAYHINVELPK